MEHVEVDNTSGRKYARFTLVATLVVSVIANITHSVLADSEITLWLRVPGAAVWPVLSFLAIEVIVRIQWRRSFAHALARLFVLGPAVPAIVVSYEHQSRLLTLMGENGLVSMIGPIAIDGLMIGCTLALLFTRALPAAIAPIAEIAEIVEPIPAEAEIKPAPKPEVERERKPRESGIPAKLILAIGLAQDGEDTATIKEKTGLSAPTIRRYASVVRTLRDNPHAPIDAGALSVRPEAVDMIRAWARSESVR